MTDYNRQVNNGQATLEYTIPSNTTFPIIYHATYNQNTQYQNKTTTSTITPRGIYVDSNYTGTIQDGHYETPYTELNTAITIAPTGGTIYLKPGVHHFTEEVTLQNITLKAFSTDYQTITNVPALQTVIDGQCTKGLGIMGGNTLIEGISFINCWKQIGGVFNCGGVNNKFYRCHFYNNKETKTSGEIYGGVININWSTGVEFESCLFDRNIGGRAAAIYIDPHNGGYLRVINCSFYDHVGNTIYVFRNGNITLTGNYITNNNALFRCTNTNPATMDWFTSLPSGGGVNGGLLDYITPTQTLNIGAV